MVVRSRIIQVVVVGAILMGASTVDAQFHSKKKDESGQTTVAPRSTTTTPDAHAEALRQSVQEAGASYSGGDMILPDGQKEALSKWNPRIGRMQAREIEVWARRIQHSDGTYTESTEDQRNNSLEQVTKSENGTTLKRRTIRLDRYGRPAEVLIRDGRGDFKYRGVLVYDQMGRFSEEQLFDAEGTLIRRKVQEYTANGLKKPLRAWDYIENVPADLKLVITRQSEEANSNPARNDRRGLFDRSEPKGNSGARQASADGSREGTDDKSTEKRKGLSLGRLFGAGKD